MKNILFFLCLLPLACKNPSYKYNERATPKAAHPEQSTKTEALPDSLNTNGEAQYLDSANFNIIRRNYVTGVRYLEVYEDKQTGLDHWKMFYKNGQLKEEGTMTSVYHINIGTWRYFSEAGKTDSIIDYDKKYGVSYFRALKIAEKQGFTMPDLEVTLTAENGRMYWRIVKWKESGKPKEKSGDYIMIDCKTAVVTNPKNRLGAIYSH